MNLKDQQTLIYFNENNDFMNPPDKKYIKEIKGNYFPGTIITLKFHLNDINQLESSYE
jgi:hypothetical protein